MSQECTKSLCPVNSVRQNWRSLCIYFSNIIPAIKIIQRLNISAMAINGQITEHAGGGMPLQNMSEITHNSKPKVCETLHITLSI
jgi:hypothetical protein